MKFSLLFFIITIFSNYSFADSDPVNSWKLLGPAFSYHFEKTGAPVVSNRTLNDGGNAVSDKKLLYVADPKFIDADKFGFVGHRIPFNKVADGENVNDYCHRYGNNIYPNPPNQNVVNVKNTIINMCKSELSEPYLVPVHEWNQKNLELGIERTSRYEDHVTRIFGAVVMDSYFKPSLLAGGAWQQTLYENDRFIIDAGATAFLWYRSIPNTKTGEISRKVVPAFLPVLSAEDKKNGIGINLSFIPAIKINRIQYTVNTLMLQFAWTI